MEEVDKILAENGAVGGEESDEDDYEDEEQEDAERPTKVAASKTKTRRRSTEETVIRRRISLDAEQRASVALGEYWDLLQGIITATNKQRQSAQIKVVCADRKDVVKKCTVEQLSAVFAERCFLGCKNGRLLLAEFVPKIGVEKSARLMHKAFLEATDTTVFVQYGEVSVMAWNNAVSQEDETLKNEILTTLFCDFFYYAATCKLEVAARFLTLLKTALLKERKKKFEELIYRASNAHIWRGASSVNSVVRYNCASILFAFYPIVSDDDPNLMNRQHETLCSLLTDTSAMIRTETCRQLMRIFGQFWLSIPENFVRRCLGIIGDRLWRDVFVGTRVAVLDGFRELLHCGSAVNVLSVALQRILPASIHDVADSPRRAAFGILRLLQSHRYINCWEVVKMQDVMNQLTVETSERVRKEIARVLLRSFFPNRECEDREYVRRLTTMASMGEVAAMTFYRVAVQYEIVPDKEALRALRTFAREAWRLLQRDRQSAMMSGIDESTMSITSGVSEFTIDADNSDKSKGANNFRRFRLLYSCATVIWALVRTHADTDDTRKEKGKHANVLLVLFETAYEYFKGCSSQLMTSIMLLGSTLNCEGNLKVVEKAIAQQLVGGKPAKLLPLPDCEPFFEACCSWNFNRVIEFIERGFEKMSTTYSIAAAPKKRVKSERQFMPEDYIERSLTFMQEILMSPMIRQKFLASESAYAERFYKLLGVVKDVVKTKVLPFEGAKVKERLPEFTEDMVLLALLLRGSLAMIPINENDKDDMTEVVGDLIEDVKWLKVVVIDNLMADPPTLHETQIWLLRKVWDKFTTTLCRVLNSCRPKPALLEVVCGIMTELSEDGVKNSMRLSAIKVLKCIADTKWTPTLSDK